MNRYDVGEDRALFTDSMHHSTRCKVFAENFSHAVQITSSHVTRRKFKLRMCSKNLHLFFNLNLYLCTGYILISCLKINCARPENPNIWYRLVGVVNRQKFEFYHCQMRARCSGGSHTCQKHPAGLLHLIIVGAMTINRKMRHNTTSDSSD